MPAVSFDSTTAPKRPRLVHVSIAASISHEQAELVRVLLDPKATRPGPVKDGKPGDPIRLKWPKDAPERVPDKVTEAKGIAPVEVVIVSSLCSSPAGRMLMLRRLRAAGLPAHSVARLGWATSVPKGGLELSSDGKKAKAKLGEPVTKAKARRKSEPKPKTEAKSEPKAEPKPDAPKPDEKK